jgi:predicted MFS family arabinose efflux permease
MICFGRHAGPRGHRSRDTALLFLAVFAAQSAFLALVSTLPQVGEEFGLGAALAGQFGAVAGFAGFATAIAVARNGSRVGAKRVLALGLLFLIGGSALAALAQSMPAMLIAQTVAGGAAAAIAVGSTAAAFIWPAPGRRAGVLAWVTLGSPGAWIVGSPLVGAVAERDWRLAWILPIGLAATVLLALFATRTPTETAPTSPRSGLVKSNSLRRWAAGELFAFTGWNGVLVFATALFAEEHGISPSTTGVLLAAIVIVYFPATLFARRFVEAHAAAMLQWLAVLAAPTVLAVGAVRTNAIVTSLLIAALASINGARGLAGGVRGQQLAPDRPMAIAGARISMMQAAGISGAATGGAALALGGWPALGIALAAAYLASALVQESRIEAIRATFGNARVQYGNSADVGAQARI